MDGGTGERGGERTCSFAGRNRNCDLGTRMVQSESPVSETEPATSTNWAPAFHACSMAGSMRDNRSMARRKSQRQSPLGSVGMGRSVGRVDGLR